LLLLMSHDAVGRGAVASAHAAAARANETRTRAS